MNALSSEEEEHHLPAAQWGRIANMTQYATHDGGGGGGGGAGPQSMPFGYDPSWLAQQPGNLQFGLPDNSSLAQQPLSGSAPGGGILNQNDNSLLGDFFSNPDITNHMEFNFDTMGESGGGGDNKAHRADGSDLFDLDAQGGAVNEPGTAFPSQHTSSDHQTPSSINQQPRTSRQMNSAYGEVSHEQSDAAGEEEVTQASAAARLVGMSTNTQNPSHMMFGNSNGYAGSPIWGNIAMNNSFMQTPVSMQTHLHSGRQSAGPQMGQHMQGHTSPFGYANASNMQQQQQQHQQPNPFGQAYAVQSRGRPHSMGDIQASGLSHLPHDEPRSAQLPPAAFAGFNSYGPTRPALNQLRYGSDEAFGNSYNPPDGYDPADEKAANLTQVPLADEARETGGRRHQPFTQQPKSSTYQSQARWSQHFNSPIPRPSSSTTYRNQTRLGGLPTSPCGNGMMPIGYGGLGMAPFQGRPSHAHPLPNVYHPHQFNSGGISTRQMQEVDQDHERDESSDNGDSDQDSSAPVSQPARKRRQSDHETDGEDEYQPRARGKRRVNSTLAASSGEDDAYRVDSSTGNKRTRGPAAPTRSSATASASTSNSPATRTPHPSSTTGGKVSRRSGTQITRTPLTEAERRKHHIDSERNRRDVIKGYYDELNDLVPALKGGKSGLSRAEVLKEIFEYIEELLAGNELMEDLLEPLKHQFRGTYDDDFDGSDEGGGGAAAGMTGESSATAC